MILQGTYGSETFSYIKLTVTGCDLGADKCVSDNELKDVSINFISLNSNPSLLGDSEEVVTYSMDYTYYKYIDPQRIQTTNIFFMESVINLKDYIMDIFERFEVSYPIFE